jgi:hypothetical protein
VFYIELVLARHVHGIYAQVCAGRKHKDVCCGHRGLWRDERGRDAHPQGRSGKVTSILILNFSPREVSTKSSGCTSVER